MRTTLALLAPFMFSATALGQQSAINAPIPQIAVASRGEVTVSPDRANIQISVQTRSETAASAASENARKQTAVISAIRGLGVNQKDIATTGYTVYPEQRYEPNKEPVIVGYTVTNTLTVRLQSIALVGQVIDAALSKGANMINSLQYYSSNTDAARKQAIAIAIQNARADAEAAAQAAGGAISGLLEINVGAYYPPEPRPIELKAAMASRDSGTPFNPGEQTVSVDVTTRWRFSSK